MRVDGLERDVGAQVRRQRVQERAVGHRVPQVAALDVSEREAAQRRDDVHGPDRPVQPLGDELAERDLLVALEPDQRRHGVVEVALAGAVLLGKRVARPLVEEVHAAGDDDLGETAAAGHGQPLRAGRVDAVHQRVGQLGERVVDDALQRALLAQVLHRRPADAVGVEDHRLVAGADQRLAQPHHARRGLAQHRDPDAVLAERARAPNRRHGPCPPSRPRRCRRSGARSRSGRGCRPPNASRRRRSRRRTRRTCGALRRTARPAASARRPAAPASPPRPAARPRRRPGTGRRARAPRRTAARPARARRPASAPRPRRASRRRGSRPACGRRRPRPRRA